MKNSRTIFLMLLTLVSVHSYPQQNKTMGDDEKRYSLVVPTSWARTISNSVFVSVIFYNDTAFKDEQLYVIYSKNSNNLKGAYNANKKSQSELKNFKLIQEADGNINGESCKWLEYTFTSDDGSIFKGKQYTLKKGTYGFTVQFTLPEALYSAKKDNFEKIISSLKLI
jgi:hypothetical protein